jgi:hypothetical protein
MNTVNVSNNVVIKHWSTNLNIILICLFVCSEPHEQFFSYLAAVTIAGRDLYRATPTATRDLGLYGLI